MAAVQDSIELRRIVALPRRSWTPALAESWADRWTDALARPARTDCPPECVCGGAGSMRLKPIQAIALSEIAQLGGGLLPIRVGGGKTLISLLAARALPHVQRPLLLLPAALRDRTRDELRAYRRHWNLPHLLRIESYQALSRVSGADLLDAYAPDLIFADEGHLLKNPSAACTRRVARYLRGARDACSFVAASGTITKRSIRDFAHLSAWSLRKASPAPADYDALDEWSRALDVNVIEHRRLAPGALDALQAPGEDVRRAYRRRLVETPGVVATQDDPLPIDLVVRSHVLDLDPALSEAYDRLRSDWTTPDEWPIEDGVAMWRHARELASGFYSRWDPRPPDDWRDARREWAATVREILGSNRRQLDTELQVRLAVPEHYRHALPALERWTRIAPTFEPNAVPVWLSDRTMHWIAEWARANGPALLWTERPAIGERLSALHGLPYYGNLGIDRLTGRSIEAHDPRTGSAVVSIDANSTGRNLQAWSRNLVIDVQPNGARWEQMLGRTHRDGQKAGAVFVDVLFGCIEDVTGFWRAVRDSSYAEDMTGQAQKLTHADLEAVEDEDQACQRSGAQWTRTN